LDLAEKAGCGNQQPTTLSGIDKVSQEAEVYLQANWHSVSVVNTPFLWQRKVLDLVGTGQEFG
jgi:hypothetical protein